MRHLWYLVHWYCLLWLKCLTNWINTQAAVSCLLACKFEERKILKLRAGIVWSLKECRKGRDAVRRKSSKRSTLLRVQVVKPVFWFPSWWPPVRVLVLLVELVCPESCFKWATFSWHLWWWSLSWWKSQWLSWWCWSELRPVYLP